MRKGSGRPRRFALQMRVRYRCVGEPAWHDARTENISRSGVLFRTRDLVDLDTEVEMTFVLPVHGSPAAIVCRGRVVRAVLSDEGPPRLAATIAAYRFVRRADAA